MPSTRPSVLVSWIALAMLGASAGLVVHAPRPTPAVQVATLAPSTTVAPTTTVPPTTTTTAPPPPPTTVPTPTTTTARPRTTTTTRATVLPAATAHAAGPTPGPTAKDPAATATPAYAMQLLQGVVPAAWLAKVPAHIEVISGQTSWSSWGGLIQIGDWQLLSSVGRARFTLAHEWGHQAAWLYGTDVFDGAPPAGFPYNGPTPEEQWADCVAQALTGTSYPSVGLGRCPSDALAFTGRWLVAGPGTPLRSS